MCVDKCSSVCERAFAPVCERVFLCASACVLRTAQEKREIKEKRCTINEHSLTTVQREKVYFPYFAMRVATWSLMRGEPSTF